MARYYIIMLDMISMIFFSQQASKCYANVNIAPNNRRTLTFYSNGKSYQVSTLGYVKNTVIVGNTTHGAKSKDCFSKKKTNK